MLLQLLFFSILGLELQTNSQLTVASQDFACTQFLIWSGNSVAKSYSAIPYSFSFNMPNAPVNTHRVDALFIGFSWANTRDLSFYLNVVFISPSTSMTLIFNPIASLGVFSMSFSIVATAIPSKPYFSVEKYQITPLLLIYPTYVQSSGFQQISLSTSSLVFTHTNYALRSFISSQIIQSNDTYLKVKTLAADLTVNSTMFQLYIMLSKVASCSLQQVTVIVVIIDYDLVYNNRVLYISSNYKVVLGNSGFTDSTFSNINLSIPARYGPAFSENCMAGIIMNEVGTNLYSRLFGFIFPDATNPNFLSFLIADNIFINFQFLCMMDCHSQAFYNSSTQQCELCSIYIAGCLQCINSTTCINCYPLRFNPKTGSCECIGLYTAKNGCTNIRDCNQIDARGLCSSCENGLQLAFDNLSCVCPFGLTYITGFCLSIPGCIAATHKNNGIQCIACNVVQNYVVEDEKCGCSQHFIFDGKQCLPQCGDGLVYHSQYCDDGNLINGDGCSSVCKAQKFYKCVNGSASHSSNCYYINKDITLSLVKIYKNNTSNQGIFTFNINPILSSYAKMNFTSLITFQTTSQCSQPQITYENGQIMVVVQYLTDLQKKQVNLTLSFNQLIVYHKPITLVFQAKGQNYPLIVFHHYSYLIRLNDFVFGLVMLTIAFVLFASFSHKMIGVQLLHVYSLVYLSLAFKVTSRDTTFSVLNNLKYLFGCYKIFQHDQTKAEFANLSSNLSLSTSFATNFFILSLILTIPIVWWVITSIYLHFRKNVNKKCLVFVGPLQNNLFYHWIMMTVALGCLYFYFTTAYIFIVENQFSYSFISSVTLLSVTGFISLVIFSELKVSFSTIKTYLHLKQRPSYFSVYFINALVMSVLFLISFAQLVGLQAITIYNVAALLFFTFYRPYHNKFYNFGVFMNNFSSTAAYICQLVNSYLSVSQEFKMIQIAAVISLLFITTFLALARAIYQICNEGHLFTKLMQKMKIQALQAKLEIKQLLQRAELPKKLQQNQQRKQEKSKIALKNPIKYLQLGQQPNILAKSQQKPILNSKLQLSKMSEDCQQDNQLEAIRERLRRNFNNKRRKPNRQALLNK